MKSHVLQLGHRVVQELGNSVGRLDDEAQQARVRIGKVERLNRALGAGDLAKQRRRATILDNRRACKKK